MRRIGLSGFWRLGVPLNLSSHTSHQYKWGASPGRLQQAGEYVSRTWIPVNTAFFAHVQAKAARGYYDNNRTALVSDLEQDFALLTYCFKALRKEDLCAAGCTNPISLLRKIESERIREILSVPADKISSHEMQCMEKSQRLRLKHLVLSTSTVELLAEKAQLDHDLALSCAILRQLGLNLIAWNYPTVYLRAIASLRTGGGSLEETLEDSLCFSALELGSYVTIGGQLPHDLEQGLFSMGLADSTEQEHARGEISIAKFCEIGEAFAILNDGEQFPMGTERSQTVVKDLLHSLGPQALSLIDERIKKKSTLYKEFGSDTFKVNFLVEKQINSVNQKHGNILFQKNHYIAKCPEDLRKQFAEIYASLKFGEVSTLGIQLLVKKLIPAAGFHSGCVYLLNPQKLELIPRLKIGKSNAYQIRTFDCAGTNGGPIVEAFYCTFPLKQEGTIINGERVSYVAGLIGNAEKAGVLYLEFFDGRADSPGNEVLLVFKAIRQCLSDCLNLR